MALDQVWPESEFGPSPSLDQVCQHLAHTWGRLAADLGTIAAPPADGVFRSKCWVLLSLCDLPWERNNHVLKVCPWAENLHLALQHIHIFVVIPLKRLGSGRDAVRLCHIGSLGRPLGRSGPAFRQSWAPTRIASSDASGAQMGALGISSPCPRWNQN